MRASPAAVRHLWSAGELLLWGAALLLVTRTTVFIRKRAADDYGAVDSQAAAQVMLVVVAGILLLALPQARTVLRRLSLAKSAVLYLTLLYAAYALSALWSPSPAYTLFRAGEWLIEFWVVIVALSYCKQFFSAERIVIGIVLVCLGLDFAGRWKLSGFSMSISGLHTNTYSSTAAMLFCYCFAEHRDQNAQRRGLLYFGGIAGAMGVLIGTSGTANFGALAGIASVFVLGLFIDGKRIQSLFLLGLTGILMLASSVSIQDSLPILVPGKTASSIAGMSGRRMLWEELIEYAKVKPVLGYGFAAGIRSLPLYGAGMRTNTAHNIFLEVLIGLGAAGLMLFGAFLVRLIRECFRGVSRPPPGRRGCIAAFTAAFVCCQAAPFVGTYWAAPSLSFCCFLALHTLQFYSSYPATSRVSDPRSRSATPLVAEVRSERYAYVRRDLL